LNQAGQTFLRETHQNVSFCPDLDGKSTEKPLRINELCFQRVAKAKAIRAAALRRSTPMGFLGPGICVNLRQSAAKKNAPGSPVRFLVSRVSV
jgi:hypothetical protein